MLLDTFDGRYSELARSLPAPLDQYVVQYSTFAGRPSKEPLVGLSSMNAVITCIPWLFWESFRELPDDLFLEIAEAGALFGMASVLVDHLIDNQAANPGETVLLHQALYEAGVARFRRTFAPDADFWAQFDRLAKEHLSGMSLELLGRSDPSCLTGESFYALASARIAPMLTVVAGLAEALDQWNLMWTVEASIKPVIVAAQMYDDVGDWQEDFEAGRITYYLASLLPPDAWQLDRKPTLKDVRQSIDANWSDVEGIGQVIDWFDESLSALQGLECRAWRKYIGEYQAIVDKHQTKLVARHILQSLRPLAAGDEAAPNELLGGPTQG
jgi:hypothetical protein